MPMPFLAAAIAMRLKRGAYRRVISLAGPRADRALPSQSGDAGRQAGVKQGSTGAMPDTYAKLCAIYLGPYAARGKSFHTDQTQQGISQAIDQFAALCRDADQLMTRLSGGKFPSIAAFGTEAESILLQLKAQCQALAEQFAQAKISDQTKISAMAVISQSDGLAAARRQQDADASLLASLEGLAKLVQGDFAQGEAPPQPGPPLPPPPGGNGGGALPPLDATRLKTKLSGRVTRQPDAVSEEIDRLSGQAAESATPDS